ncbi:site-specific DNA-methyltransferase [Paeniglutamicibacter antarcticus]|uniref:Site-specific DNA-methyltransferase n=1 Tax=Arthrobacter terrae TaxID=2935737 RepID=A0A931CP59_9MICC|nr:DNA methyltransferase [Arthrobacter terrae]MBG0738964.1 site-specific DNA-methyltransferase [Arthrobacter terrae]
MSIQTNTAESAAEYAAHIDGMTAQPLMSAPSSAETTSSLDRYLAEITDPVLRGNLAREIGGMQRQFGLVFERHHPEGIRLPKHAVKRGSKVVISSVNGTPRKDSAFYRVHKLNRANGDGQSSTALLVDAEGDEAIFPVADLTVAKEFGDIMYPGLRKLSEIRRGDPDAPVHTVINGENYHALEALQYTHAGKVDLIYIDPPYNTGNSDWKYNDRYVDSKDGYRHSKWLSFMEKRLIIAKTLLKPTGVIIMAIDDNEHHRFRMLADEVFGEINFISNLVWQGSRKNDAQFASPSTDYMLVYAKDAVKLTESGRRWVEAKPGVDDVLEMGQIAWRASIEAAFAEIVERYESSPEYWANCLTVHPDTFETKQMWVLNNLDAPLGESVPSWDADEIRAFAAQRATAELRRWWKSIPSDHAAKSNPGLKLYDRVDDVRFGEVYCSSDLAKPGPTSTSRYDLLHPVTGKPVAMHPNGWRYAQDVMHQKVKESRILFGNDHKTTARYKRYLHETVDQSPLPAFDHDRSAATKHLEKILSDKRFPFPKNHDVLMRWFRMIAPSDAVILDFFGGSGTTAEAVIRLNAEDGGTRQAILVTNNELAKADDTKLRKSGHKPGDDEYEALGVFHHVTKPRLETVVTGTRQDGSPYSDGLAANVAFFELTYLDEPEIVTGRAFNDLAGLFWLKAGGVGGTVELTPGAKADGFAISEFGRTAVLFSPGRAKALGEKLSAAEHTISHLFIVTDSEAQGDEAATHFRGGITVERIYGSYLEAFQVNRKD